MYRGCRNIDRGRRGRLEFDGTAFTLPARFYTTFWDSIRHSVITTTSSKLNARGQERSGALPWSIMSPAPSSVMDFTEGLFGEAKRFHHEQSASSEAAMRSP
jgi:hypothetical protein